MQKGKHTVIIFNPASGTGDSKKQLQEITEIARNMGWHGKVQSTTLKKNAAEIALSEIKKEATHIVVCGGDGTIMETVGTIVNKPVVMGVVPLGTGNLFAKNLNIPLLIEESLQVALKGRVQKIDVGRANGTFFTIMAGIGLDAEVMKNSDSNLKKKIGFLAYAVAALKRLQKKSDTYAISVNSKRPRTYRARSIMIANMGKIQGGIKIVPAANPQSGKLKIGVIQPKSLFSWINLSVHALFGNINKSAHYTLLEGKSVTIQTNTKKTYECDGNDFPPTNKLTIEIFPSALKVMTP